MRASNNTSIDISNDVIQSYFDDAQGALQSSRLAEADAGRMRKELEVYLDEAANKIDSEGNNLITIPSNFDAIVSAMNRDDVISTDEKPWNKYLLATNDLGFEKSFSQRYNHFIDETKETKVQIGLAEIHLLDKQLGLLSRKEAILSHQDQSESQTDDGSDMPLTNRSNVTTPRSVMSKRDATFLTRTNKGSTVGARSEKSSPSSPLSPKKGSTYSESDQGIDHYDTQQDEELDELIDGRSYNQKKTKNKNFLKQNIDRLGSKALLSRDEEERLKQLLEDDVENQPNFMEYGYTLDLIDYEKQLDSELANYGRLDRLRATDDGSKCSPGNSKNGQPDYLAEQRELRAQQEYSLKIDRMLETVTSDLMDLSEMIRPATRSPSDLNTDVQSKYCLEVPSINDIQVGKRISVEDVMNMVNIAIQEVGLDADINVSENRREIDRLLGGLKSEIDRLTCLRMKSQYYRGISSPFHKSIDNFVLSSNQDLEYDEENRNNYEYDNDDDDDEILIEEPINPTFLPQLPIKGLKNRSISCDYKEHDDRTSLPDIMQKLSQQIASVKAAAATKNKLFINRLLSNEIKQEIRKVLH